MAKYGEPGSPRPTFAFLTGYDVRWSSFRFYAEMMQRLRRVAERHGYPTCGVASLGNLPRNEATVLVLDPAALILLAERGSVDELAGRRYVLVIGEVIDPQGHSFIGWDTAPSLREMHLGPGGRLRNVIEHAWKVTWQNRRVRSTVAEIRGEDDALFFPIDGYEESLVITDRDSERDVDLLIYGTMAHPRRYRFVARLLASPLLSDKRIVIASNVFRLDDLLARTRLVLHVNSADDTDQAPYAKLIRPLANNIQIFAESTVELEASDLRLFVQTFDVNDPEALFRRLRDALSNFDSAQAAFEALNPRGRLAEDYNFERNARRLLSL